MHILGLHGHAAARLHLSAGVGLGRSQPRVDHRRRADRRRASCSLPGQRASQPAPRQPMRRHNPWDAPGLEWATSSPPPPYNFDRIPVVHEPHAALDRARRRCRQVSGLAVDEREVLVTTVTDARPTCARARPSRPSGRCRGDRHHGACSSARSSPSGRWCGSPIPLTAAAIIWFWPKKPVDDT